MDERANPLTGRLIFGLALAVLGALWTLDNLDLVEAEAITRWWSVIPLAVGLMKLTGFGMEKQRPFGAFLAIFGAIFLLDELGAVHASINVFWPLAFIFLGVNLTMRALRGPGPEGAAGEEAGDYVRSFALMAGLTRRSASPNFRGGDLSAMMGGVELDLTQARPADGRAVVEVFAMWGGIEIRVPDDWRVEVEATPIMGGVECNARLAPGVEPVGTLIVRGFVMMGGVEIKNGALGTSHKHGVIVRTRESTGGPAPAVAPSGRSEKGIIHVPPPPGGATQPPVDPR